MKTSISAGLNGVQEQQEMRREGGERRVGEGERKGRKRKERRGSGG